MDTELWSLAIFRGLFNIRVCLGSEKQDWKLFCSMLDKFVEKLDYARWFSNNSLKIPPSNLNRKLSYVELAKSSLSSSPVPRPIFKVIDQTPSKKSKAQKLVHLPPSKQKDLLIKNLEVVKVNFENLWTITKLFASDDWKLIRKVGSFFPIKYCYKSFIRWECTH